MRTSQVQCHLLISDVGQLVAGSAASPASQVQLHAYAAGCPCPLHWGLLQGACMHVNIVSANNIGTLNMATAH